MRSTISRSNVSSDWTSPSSARNLPPTSPRKRLSVGDSRSEASFFSWWVFLPALPPKRLLATIFDPDAIPLRHIIGLAVGEGLESLGLGKDIEPPDWLQRSRLRLLRHACHLRGGDDLLAISSARLKVRWRLLHLQRWSGANPQYAARRRGRRY